MRRAPREPGTAASILDTVSGDAARGPRRSAAAHRSRARRRCARRSRAGGCRPTSASSRSRSRPSSASRARPCARRCTCSSATGSCASCRGAARSCGLHGRRRARALRAARAARAAPRPRSRRRAPRDADAAGRCSVLAALDASWRPTQRAFEAQPRLPPARCARRASNGLSCARSTRSGRSSARVRPLRLAREAGRRSSERTDAEHARDRRGLRRRATPRACAALVHDHIRRGRRGRLERLARPHGRPRRPRRSAEMCGICGIQLPTSRARSAATLVDMCQAMRHRGDDSTGFALYGEPDERPAHPAPAHPRRRGLGARGSTTLDGSLRERGVDLARRAERRRRRTTRRRPLRARCDVDAGTGEARPLVRAIETPGGIEIQSIGRSLEIVKDLGDAEPRRRAPRHLRVPRHARPRPRAPGDGVDRSPSPTGTRSGPSRSTTSRSSTTASSRTTTASAACSRRRATASTRATTPS